MKNFLIAFLVFLVWSFFGLWLYSWLQPGEENSIHKTELANIPSEETQTDSVIAIPNNLGDSIIDTEIGQNSILLSENEDEILEEVDQSTGLKATNQNGDIVFLLPEGISITQNSPELVIPNQIKDFKYNLNTYFIENPDQELHIHSLYSALENIESPNLGIQRGEHIKSLLTGTGIEANRIVVKPMIKNIDFNAQGTYENSISFGFKPLDEERIEALKNAIPEIITLYPSFSNSGIQVSSDLQEVLEKIKEAVVENPEIEVEIIGHTDNVGNANDNYLLALKYARQVRWYFVTKGGIDRKKIKATSRGESESIASNKTTRGRTLNRRIEVKFN